MVQRFTERPLGEEGFSGHTQAVDRRDGTASAAVNVSVMVCVGTVVGPLQGLTPCDISTLTKEVKLPNQLNLL